LNSASQCADPVIESYKQLVDRQKLRENLKCTVDERLQNLQNMANASQHTQQHHPGPEHPWQSVSDCGPNRSTDPVIELYKQDVDRTLLRENLRRSVEERCLALESMATLVDELHHHNATRQNRDGIRPSVETS
jgi:hypothetical protein